MEYDCVRIHVSVLMPTLVTLSYITTISTTPAMLALCSGLHEYEHTKHQHVAMHTLWACCCGPLRACSAHCYYHYDHPPSSSMTSGS